MNDDHHKVSLRYEQSFSRRCNLTSMFNKTPGKGWSIGVENYKARFLKNNTD